MTDSKDAAVTTSSIGFAIHAAAQLGVAVPCTKIGEPSTVDTPPIKPSPSKPHEDTLTKVALNIVVNNRIGVNRAMIYTGFITI